MTTILNKLAARTGVTWNGAVSYSTTGVAHQGNVLDYFAKCGTYSNRPQNIVDSDMVKIFADDPGLALRLVFGLRLITRKPKDTASITECQTGFGRRDEFYKAIVWLHNNRPEELYRNLHLIPVFGCWRDFFTEPLIDVLNQKAVMELVRDNLLDNQLLRKYLPQVNRSKSNVRSNRDGKRTLWAKRFCNFVGISPKDYRKMKSCGTAHIWQKQMAAKEWEKIHFNGIPGKAMLHATSRTGRDQKTVFERHGLVEKLTEWVLKQKSVKFNGYPYELTKAAQTAKSLVQKIIYNKQFETLIEPMRGHKLGNVLCALDTSGSMSWSQVAPNVQPIDVCLSMGLVFSALNVGYFKDAVIAFDSKSELVKLKGDFCERFEAVRHIGAMGSTNFQSVIDLLVQIREQNPEIPLNEYPDSILVVSDMQFNPVGGNTQTNYEVVRQKLRDVGLGEMRLIWWYVNGAGTDFPASMDEPGCYIIGGFDPVNLKALMGLSESKKDFDPKEKKEQTPLDGMLNFFAQPIFGLVE